MEENKKALGFNSKAGGEIELMNKVLNVEVCDVTGVENGSKRW